MRIGEVVSQFTARETALPDKEYKMAGVKWYAEGVFHRETVLGSGMSAKQVTPLVPGALSYNRLFAWKESFAVVGREHEGLCVSSEFSQFMPDAERVLPDFLYLFCTLPKTIEAVNAASVGSAAVSRNRFKEEEFLKLEMPLPPRAEQRAIVERWRSAQAQIAAATNLVEEIKTESAARFLADLGLKAAPSSQMPKSFAIRWADMPTWSGSTAFKRLTIGDIYGGKFPVARGHDFITEVCHGCSAPPSPVPTELEILKISAVTRGEFVPTEKKFAADNLRVREQFDLRKGDVLLCRTNGTLDHVGMSAIVPEDQSNLIFPDKVIRVRAKPEIIRPDYLWLVLQTPFLRDQIEAAARTAVGNYAIGGKNIWNFEVPLPPLEVQRKLVERVTAAWAEMARERAAAAQLRQTIAAEVEHMILGTRPLPES